jgi:transcriptional regulator with XRE-family HTH domain
MSATTRDNPLGSYMKDRRAKLDATALGYAGTRRRTPGLRREEVAQRANISATWYTWLEQGRGGAPSAEVLDRIARALMLTHAEREHLFLLGLGRPPKVQYQAAENMSPRLQRVLDALAYSPAFVKTQTWDVVAWNPAAAAVFRYHEVPQGERNILRRVFRNSGSRIAHPDRESVARFVVGAFRADVVRAGAAREVEAMVEELCRESPEFESMWRDNDVRAYGEGTKHLQHPVAGLLAMEYSSFVIDGRPDLSMVVYNPATPEDAERVRALMETPKAPEAAGAP